MTMPTHICTYPENMVKISPLYSEIIYWSAIRERFFIINK